jgi:serine/threonine protein kinase
MCQYRYEDTSTGLGFRIPLSGPFFRAFFSGPFFFASALVMCGLERCAPVALGVEWARGAFGSVHVVDTPSAPTGRIAVKRVADTPGHVNRELETCIRLALDPHAGIVRVLGYWTEKAEKQERTLRALPVVDAEPEPLERPGRPERPERPETLQTLYLVMEFFPETLRGVLDRLAESSMRMKTGRMASLMGQLASALGHLEKLGLMHRDLKPDNALVDVQTNRLVLCDFGSAKFVERGCGSKPSATYVCTRFYRSPELILGRDLYSTSVDIWSFGCILAEFAYGGPLFTGDTQVEVMSRIIWIRGMVTVEDIAHMPTSVPEPLESLEPLEPLCLGALGWSMQQTAAKPWSKVFTRRVGKGRRVSASYGAWYEEVLDACLRWSPVRRVSARDLSLLPAFR